MKKILGLHSAPRPHWVGDGFPVRSLFGYDGLGRDLSPFLLLDHAAPTPFAPAAQPRGVGAHPHRGFETVTIVYQGELAHRDSTGAGGLIGPGDVQWMTAAGGIVHEEFHSPAFTRQGGTIEMVQLWVNLPARDKMGPAGYQTLLDADIPSVDLPDGAGRVRVIAGAFGASQGPASTFTPIDVLDIRLHAGRTGRFTATPGHTLALVVLHGTVQVNGEAVAREGQLVHLAREGRAVEIEANTDATVLWLAGAPIDEPVVGYGPFVMNSEAEIHQAIADFNSGRFGGVPATDRA
ncbi:pirin family protein [Pseudorhodoferax sp. Leaf274]|uniref:pirin family protein n=1 Tax=Pseudorhodoferax sp. Leaf274 TaxID=1736318 RepID=UPI0007025D60|nr:pirin family protein [Pseudorhodoferax sp. Leaf274]KQP38913.1 quercetin 2,3-dioxygenase [Pseudorhodoferax sp. Leaf274]